MKYRPTSIRIDEAPVRPTDPQVLKLANVTSAFPISRHQDVAETLRKVSSASAFARAYRSGMKRPLHTAVEIVEAVGRQPLDGRAASATLFLLEEEATFEGHSFLNESRARELSLLRVEFARLHSVIVHLHARELGIIAGAALESDRYRAAWLLENLSCDVAQAMRAARPPYLRQVPFAAQESISKAAERFPSDPPLARDLLDVLALSIRSIRPRPGSPVPSEAIAELRHMLARSDPAESAS